MRGLHDQARAFVGWLYALKRWMYRGGRPGSLARVMNRMSEMQFSAGLFSPKRAMTLEVPGRRTGRVISFPVVVADYHGDRYLVSMLGNDANWVRNVQAAGGRAVLGAATGSRSGWKMSTAMRVHRSCADTWPSPREPGHTYRATDTPRSKNSTGSLRSFRYSVCASIPRDDSTATASSPGRRTRATVSHTPRTTASALGSRDRRAASPVAPAH